MHRIHSWAKAHAFNRELTTQDPSTHLNNLTATTKTPQPQHDGEVNKSAGIPASAGSDAEKEQEDPKPGLAARLKDGIGRFGGHTRRALFHSWVNVLLIFVPVGIAAEAAGLSPGIVFATNAIAIIPLAGLLSHATECVASRLGDTVGALINVTFGNAVELIIFVIALVQDEIRIVQASLLGSILANLLLILGMAFLLGGLRFQEQIYNSTVTQMSACLLSLSVTSLLLPTAFHASWSSDAAAEKNTLKVSRGTSVVLLLVYVLYIIFQLKSHSYLYASIPQQIIDEESHPGILADFMHNSSDSADSSSDDSDDTTTSWTTAKRIRRAMKSRRRRKSSISSKGTASSHPLGKNPSFDARSTGMNDKSRSIGDLSSNNQTESGPFTIDFGDDSRYEADHDTANRFNEPRTRDFGQSPVRDKVYKKNSKSKKRANFLTEQDKDAAPVTTQVQQQSLPSHMSAPITDPDSPQKPADDAADLPRKWSPFRPSIPSLLSNTVFSSSPTSNSIAQGNTSARPGGLRRSHSLPIKMNRPPPVGNAVGFALGAARMPATGDASVSTIVPEPVEPEMSRTAAVVMLLLSTALVAVCAEFLVDAIPAMMTTSSISEAFIGMIILPIVGNAAEHVTAVSVATKNKMDLAIGVSVGSSIQIAIFVTPLVVILGWCMDKDMSLYFTLFETICLFVTAFVVNFLVLDGRSNYLEGALLIAAYVIISVAAFFYPSDSQSSSFGNAGN